MNVVVIKAKQLCYEFNLNLNYKIKRKTISLKYIIHHILIIQTGKGY